jgi:multidrug efflux system outer membrane protein
MDKLKDETGYIPERAFVCLIPPGATKKWIEEVGLQKERVEALREFARLSQLKFDKGVAGYLEVLIAENERFAAELASVRILADRYAQVVNVYQAMGGGWVDVAGSMTAP